MKYGKSGPIIPVIQDKRTKPDFKPNDYDDLPETIFNKLIEAAGISQPTMTNNIKLLRRCIDKPVPRNGRGKTKRIADL